MRPPWRRARRTPGALRTVSLRRRVTVLSLVVLAAVLALVTALADVVFVAQSRADLASRLEVRAELAEQLVVQGIAPDDVVDRLEAPGLRVRLVTADGTVHVSERDTGPGALVDGPGRDGGPGRGPRGADRPDADDQAQRSTLSDGSELTLVASGAPVTAARDLLLRTLLLLGVGALLVAAAVMLVTTRVALAPLDAMTRLARSITRGDRGRRLAPSRTDTELGRTAAAFDAMLDELEGAERQARSAETAARESESRTRRFVADAAHELRTPLAGVQAVAEATLSPSLPADERERLQLLLLRESRRAGRLVDDLLALARIDAGIDLRRDPVDLLALAGTEAERARLLAPEQPVEVSGTAVLVEGEEERLGQVVANLLDNARRYAPGAPVHLTVDATADGARLLVHDGGPGVAAADRERVFDRLVRLDEARSGAGGAGLGLAIARGIARAHGGDLRCVEPPAGGGAAFELRLPAQSSPTGALRT